MPVEVVTGDIFQDGADVLVNPVNCVGVMGAGLAKEFKRRWPQMFKMYTNDCLGGIVALDHGPFHGRGVLYPGMPHGSNHWGRVSIYCLPTKDHWRHASKAQDIRVALSWMIRTLGTNPTRQTIAMPALGCGLGGLDFADVLPLIVDAFEGTSYEVRVYSPR